MTGCGSSDSRAVAAESVRTTASRLTVALRASETGAYVVLVAVDEGRLRALHVPETRALRRERVGAAVGGGSWLLRWGADAMPLMRPAWGAMNVALLGLGLALAVLGRQPGWVDALGLRVWRTIEAARGSGTASRRTSPRRPLLAGLAWALVPCGLLYSALATAALSLLRHEGEKLRVGELGRRLFEERYTAARGAKAYEHVYDEALATRR